MIHNIVNGRSWIGSIYGYMEIEAHTPVILGEEGDEALLGAVTLEILGLVFNPFKRTLQPIKMLLV